MHDDFRVGKLLAHAQYGVAAELDVRVTIPAPQSHRAAGLFHDPRAEIFIWHEEQITVFGRGIDDFYRIAAGADDIAEGLYFRAAIDVSDGVKVWVGCL